MAEKFWVLCGKPENWDIALRDEIWGLIPKFGGKWKYLQEKEWLFFYATSPIKGVIGLGRVQTKFKQNKPLWPDEILKREVLYPFRFEFQSEYVLPQDRWGAEKIVVHLPIGSYSAMNLLDDQDIIDGLWEAIKRNWPNTIDFEPRTQASKAEPVGRRSAKNALELSHDGIKDMIFEIGKMHRYITEKEYQMNGDRLDVVWRRVEKSVPTYVFEIQIGGDLYQALAKLKHAYDIWNSNISVVIDEKHRDKVDELLGGTFHEIRSIINIVNLQQIQQLYSLQSEDMKLRQEMGLP